MNKRITVFLILILLMFYNLFAQTVQFDVNQNDDPNLSCTDYVTYFISEFSKTKFQHYSLTYYVPKTDKTNCVWETQTVAKSGKNWVGRETTLFFKGGVLTISCYSVPMTVNNGDRTMTVDTYDTKTAYGAKQFDRNLYTQISNFITEMKLYTKRFGYSWTQEELSALWALQHYADLCAN